MLEEIRLFFEGLRVPAPKWPENLSALDPVVEGELRAESERHWRLAMEAVDKMEARIVGLYEVGADVPAAIDLIDEVVAIIRRKDKPRKRRVKEIGRLMDKWAAAMSPRPSGR
jgi:hypothetical protein